MNNMKNQYKITKELFEDMRLCLQTQQKKIHTKVKQNPSTELLEFFKALNHMLELCEELQHANNEVIAEYNRTSRSYGEMNLLRIIDEMTMKEKIEELTTLVDCYKEGMPYKEAVLQLFYESPSDNFDADAEADHEAILRGIQREEEGSN